MLQTFIAALMLAFAVGGLGFIVYAVLLDHPEVRRRIVAEMKKARTSLTG